MGAHENNAITGTGSVRVQHKYYNKYYNIL